MTDKKIDFQSLSAELEEIIAKLQSTDANIDESMALYDKGMKIAIQLEDYLENAENKVTEIKKDWDSLSKE